ncbi:MAG: Uma2 family endonuclease [Bacteroidetes bacterium QH_10_64_19]|nr:MAG: Uma2 family endonuclease [Bacteroidetes bacterium QH_10_64_19]
MSTAVAPRRTTVEEYLTLDAEADEVRYEYLDGRVWALAGATPPHNLVKDNVRTELHTRIRPRECRSFTSDQRVKLADGRYVYPDVVVVCGPPEYTDESPPSLVNPELLVEVTSESTSDRDHEDKLDAYLQLDSLQEYWIASPSRVLLTRRSMFRWSRCTRSSRPKRTKMREKRRRKMVEVPGRRPGETHAVPHRFDCILKDSRC